MQERKRNSHYCLKGPIKPISCEYSAYRIAEYELVRSIPVELATKRRPLNRWGQGWGKTRSTERTMKRAPGGAGQPITQISQKSIEFNIMQIINFFDVTAKL